MNLYFAANSPWRKQQKRLQIYFGIISANNIPPICREETRMAKARRDAERAKKKDS